MIFMNIFILANTVQFQPKDLPSTEKSSDDTVQLLGVFYSAYLLWSWGEKEKKRLRGLRTGICCSACPV